MALEIEKNLIYREDIASLINAYLSRNPLFAGMKETSIFTGVSEIFIGLAEFLMYYVRRTAEENFSDSARLDSSIYLLAKNKDYSIRRPVPAEAFIDLELKGPFPPEFGSYKNLKIKFAKEETSFSFDNKEYILAKDYEFVVPNFELQRGVNNKDYKISLILYNIENKEGDEPVPIKIYQGEYKTIEFSRDKRIIDNSSILFQRFKIEDDTFSNFYGDKDPRIDENNYASGITKIWIDPPPPDDEITSEDDKYCRIESGNLFKSEFLYERLLEKKGNAFVEPLKICAVSTGVDKTVNIDFGDSLFSIEGIKEGQTLFVQYLSTEGAAANKIGVISKKLEVKNLNYEMSSAEVGLIDWNMQDKVVFSFDSNITGGKDIENKAEIKMNSAIDFNSNKTLVDRADYENYFRRNNILSMKNIALWGEQELLTRLENGSWADIFAAKDVANIIFYSALGTLYNNLDGVYSLKFRFSYNEDVSSSNFPETVWLDANNIEFDYTLGGREILALSRMQRQIWQYKDAFEYIRNPVSPSPRRVLENSFVKRIERDLRKKSLAGLEYISVRPLIQWFELAGNIVISNYADRIETKNKINNAVYQYLSESQGYNSAVNLSALFKIITNFKEVLSCNIKFVPMHDLGDSYFDLTRGRKSLIQLENQFDVDPQYAGLSKTDIENYVYDSLYNFVNNGYMKHNVRQKLEYFDLNGRKKDFYIDSQQIRVNVVSEDGDEKQINEKNFWNIIAQEILDKLASSNLNSTDKNRILSIANRAVKQFILYSMIDEQGNISNFSLPNEIAAICIDRDFLNYPSYIDESGISHPIPPKEYRLEYRYFNEQ